MGKTVVGYASRLSVRAGEGIAFHASTYQPGPVDVGLVRLTGCDDPADGGVFEETSVAVDWAGEKTIPHQPIFAGSYVVAEGLRCVGSDGGVHFGIFVWQNEQVSARQTIVSIQSGDSGGRLELSLENKVPRLTFDDAVVASSPPINARDWTLLLVDIDTSGQATVRQYPAANTSLEGLEARGHIELGWEDFRVSLESKDSAAQRQCWLGAGNREGRPAQAFDGKLEQPAFFERPLTSGEVGVFWEAEGSLHARLPCIHFWDFGSEIASDVAFDRAPAQCHCRLVNRPTRAVCGRKWDGTITDWRISAAHHGALHFHSDAIADAGWEPFVSWTVPEGLSNGLYAAKLTHNGNADYLPFYVLPPRNVPKPAIAFLAPTASYLAYANITVQSQYPELYPQMRIDKESDAFLLEHPEFGGGLYDLHPDGSGVHYSALLRPILNFCPKASNWAFTADGDVIAWLEESGEDYDMITDDALHREGVGLLDGYRVIVTGTHPEYWSTPMMDSLKDWLSRGGRLMYMGGNGFYWRIAFDPSGADCIEVRRAEDGTRAWLSEPGEYHHSFNGELGGMWRRLGTPPQSLVGVGFCAQGFGGSSHYRLTKDADDPRVSFILAGVDDEIIGDFGLHGGGAAGEEIDRADHALGTPAHAIVIASSEDHNAFMVRAKEELWQSMPPGIEDPEVRADMVFFETPSGGAVWSSGSIAWAGSLAHNNYKNSVASITSNVLRRFASPELFEVPSRTAV